MQRGHCDDGQQAFPPASCNADIAPREVTPPDPRDGPRGENLGLEQLARRKPARRPPHVERCGIARDAGAPMEEEDACKRKLLGSRLLPRSCNAGHSTGRRAYLDAFDRRLLVLGDVSRCGGPEVVLVWLATEGAVMIGFPLTPFRQIFAICLLSLFVGTALADPPIEAVNTEHGLAIKGYDPVSYFTTGNQPPVWPSFRRPTRGRPIGSCRPRIVTGSWPRRRNLCRSTAATAPTRSH